MKKLMLACALFFTASGGYANSQTTKDFFFVSIEFEEHIKDGETIAATGS